MQLTIHSKEQRPSGLGVGMICYQYEASVDGGPKFYARFHFIKDTFSDEDIEKYERELLIEEWEELSGKTT